MRTFLFILYVVGLVYAIGFIYFRVRERNRRKPVIFALRGKPRNRLDLPAIDLTELHMDRVCLMYWTESKLAWQFTQRWEDDIRTLPFDKIRGLAVNQDPPLLRVEAGKRAYGWQFRPTRHAATLISQLTNAILAAAPPNIEKGLAVGERVLTQLGPLA